MSIRRVCLSFCIAAVLISFSPCPSQAIIQDMPDKLRVLFIGDNGHHQPENRANQIQPYMSARGIQIVYTDHTEALNPETLANYHAIILYGNAPYISAEQERALFEFVEQGGGLVPVHAGIAMFANSDAYTTLVGATFKSHGHGTFSTRFIEPDHPALAGVEPFESWDETYIHMRHNPDKIVLSVQEEHGQAEPWTWVRNHGQGRVFYTAWGHDERTWSNPGFHKLLERGIRWAAGDWALSANWAPPELSYAEGTVPYYPPGLGWGIIGDPVTEIQNPLPPEESMQQTFVEPGFHLELFAAEPDIVNPIDMDWDERGRLWVVESLDYPNTFTEDRQGNDRIKILEDTDNDGKADKITIFAENLNIPTSLVLARGGVIVAQAPDMLFLQDTDGDDKADVTEVLFTGWGTFDTHAGPSNLRYGFDNQIWGAVGYSAFNGAVNGDSIRFGQALYRFKSDGSSLEHMSSFNNNTWGLAISEEGYVFGSTANRNPSNFVAIPERYYKRIGDGKSHVVQTIADKSNFYPITDRVRQVDQHGHYTSGAGYELYTARDFPKSYWNKVAFIGGPTGHLLGKFVHEPEGSGFKAINEGNMVASRDEWFSPIQSRVGPDGAVWFIDWYNLIIQHNPVPDGYENGEGNAYEIGLRDTAHSRIYRLVSDGMPVHSDEHLVDASGEMLIERLQSTNMFWRLMAQRFIVENNHTELAPALIALIQNEQRDELGLNTPAIHAIWALHGLGMLSEEGDALSAVYDAFYHPSIAVRRAALMAVPRDKHLLNHILQAGILPEPSVPENMDYTVGLSMMDAANGSLKLAALLALADVPFSEKAGQTIAYAAHVPENANDMHIKDASIAAGMQHDYPFLMTALKHTPASQDTVYIANLGAIIGGVAGRYAATGASQDLMGIIQSLQGASDVVVSSTLQAFNEYWPDGQTPSFSEMDRSTLQELMGQLSDDDKSIFEELATKWQIQDLLE